MQETNKIEDILKCKRIKLLNDLLDNMQLSIKTNKIKGEIPKKIFLYSRIADFTYYSEVSIRKFLSGSIPKDIAGFISGIIKYGHFLKVGEDYLTVFAKEYAMVSSAVVIENAELVSTKNNLMVQDLSSIVRNSKLTKFLDDFLAGRMNMCNVYGYRLSGKSTSVMAYVYDLINRTNKFNAIVWNKIMKNKDQNNQILDNMIDIIDENIKTGEIKETLKREICVHFIRNSKTLIIVDTEENNLTQEAISLLIEMQNYAKIILISSMPIENNEEDFERICKGFSMNSGMEKSEIEMIINLHSELKMLTMLGENIIDLVYELTGGFPFASLYICKKIVQENKFGRELKNSIEHYKEFNDKGYEILSSKIIDETWEEMTDLAHKILMICAIFKHSVSLKLVAYVCDIQVESEQWRKALKECYNNGMLNHIILNNPRCTMNNMIQTLILSKIKRNSINMEYFYDGIAKYYQKLSFEIGECYNDLDKLKLLDELDEFDIVLEVLELLYYHQRYKEYIEINTNLKYYTYVRGYWKIGAEILRIKRAQAAKKIENKNAEVEAICDYINTMAKQKNKREAEQYLQMVTQIIEIEKETIQKRVLALYYHVKALYLYNCCEDYQKAYGLWKMIEKTYHKDSSEYRELVHHLWLNKCRVKIEGNSSGLYSTLVKDLELTKEKKFIRGSIEYYLLLANLSFEEYKKDNKNSKFKNIQQNLEEAKKLLNNKSILDKRNEAEFYRISTLVYYYDAKEEKMKLAYEKACEAYNAMNCIEDIKILDKQIEQIRKEK